MNCSNSVSSSLIDFFFLIFLIRMVRVNYRATYNEIKAWILPLQRGAVGWSSGIDPRREKEGGVDRVFPS